MCVESVMTTVAGVMSSMWYVDLDDDVMMSSSRAEELGCGKSELGGIRDVINVSEE